LSVALIDFNGVVDIVNYHGVVGDVLDHAGTTAALEITGQGRGSVGPDFDASTVLSNCKNLFVLLKEIRLTVVLCIEALKT